MCSYLWRNEYKELWMVIVDCNIVHCVCVCVCACACVCVCVHACV